jgi:hypothetical protein
MRTVMAAVYDACNRHRIPIGLAPNIEVSLVVTPDDAAMLARRDWSFYRYELWRRSLRVATRPVFRHRPRTRPLQPIAPAFDESGNQRAERCGKRPSTSSAARRRLSIVCSDRSCSGPPDTSSAGIRAAGAASRGPSSSGDLARRLRDLPAKGQSGPEPAESTT